MRIGDLVSAPAVVEKLFASTPERAVRELVGRAAHPAAFAIVGTGRLPLERLTLAQGRGVALLKLTGEKVEKPVALHSADDTSWTDRLTQKPTDLSSGRWVYLVILLVLLAEQAMAVRLSYHTAGAE